MLIAFVFSFFASQSQGAILGNVNTSNSIVKAYVKEELSTELLNMKAYGERWLSFDTTEAFNSLVINIQDVKPPHKEHNASEDMFKHEITVSVLPDQNVYGREELRSTLAHEFGHFIFDEYALKNSRSLPRLIQLNNNLLRPSQGGPPSDWEVKNNLSRILEWTTILILEKPYTELFADVFRVSYMKEPGQHAFRNFSNLWWPYAWYEAYFTDDEHNIFHPVRRYLWNNWLSKNLGNETELTRGAIILMEILCRQLDRAVSQLRIKNTGDIHLDNVKENKELLRNLQAAGL